MTQQTTAHSERTEEYILRAEASIGSIQPHATTDAITNAAAAIAHALLDVASAIRETNGRSGG